MRFTLGKMFLAIAMLALACAGMMYRTPLWTNGIFSFSIALYLFVAVLTFGLRKRSLVAAVAFSMVGGIYLLLAQTDMGRYQLLTNNPLALIARIVNLPNDFFVSLREVPVEEVIDRSLPWNSARGESMSDPNLYSFFRIGHCVWSWLFAILAAWFAGWMYDRRERATKEAP